MINAAKKRGKRSGAELDKPFSITVAPTGVAAYLVNGTTIESALKIQPSKDRTYIKNEPSRNSSLRFLYEDLRVIFIDEVSMLGSNMLTKMNFRMQDIMGNTKLYVLVISDSCLLFFRDLFGKLVLWIIVWKFPLIIGMIISKYIT